MAKWLATWTANPEVQGSNPVRAGKYLRDALVSPTYTTRRVGEDISILKKANILIRGLILEPSDLCQNCLKILHVQSTLDISKLWGLFFTSSNYPKCKLICTSGRSN